MSAPRAVFPDGTPEVKLEIACIIVLSLLYFFVHLCLHISRTLNQFTRQAHSKASDVFELVSYTMNCNPMLCIIFFCCRMRALQIDVLTGGSIPNWSQICIWVCVGSVILQAITTITVSHVFGGEAHRGVSAGDIRFESNFEIEARGTRCLTALMEIFRWFLVGAIYTGYSFMCYTLYNMRNERPGEHTPNLPRVMQCILLLAGQYTLIHLSYFVAQTIHQCLNMRKIGDDTERHRGLESLETGLNTVEYCPMLCVLMLSCHMRSDLLTSNHGHPSAWAQDAMVILAASILLQLLLMPIQICLPPDSVEETSPAVKRAWSSSSHAQPYPTM